MEKPSSVMCQLSFNDLTQFGLLYLKRFTSECSKASQPYCTSHSVEKARRNGTDENIFTYGKYIYKTTSVFRLRTIDKSGTLNWDKKPQDRGRHTQFQGKDREKSLCRRERGRKRGIDGEPRKICKHVLTTKQSDTKRKEQISQVDKGNVGNVKKDRHAQNGRGEDLRK